MPFRHHLQGLNMRDVQVTAQNEVYADMRCHFECFPRLASHIMRSKCLNLGKVMMQNEYLEHPAVLPFKEILDSPALNAGYSSPLDRPTMSGRNAKYGQAVSLVRRGQILRYVLSIPPQRTRESAVGLKPGIYVMITRYDDHRGRKCIQHCCSRFELVPSCPHRKVTADDDYIRTEIIDLLKKMLDDSGVDYSAKVNIRDMRNGRIHVRAASR